MARVEQLITQAQLAPASPPLSDGSALSAHSVARANVGHVELIRGLSRAFGAPASSGGGTL